MIIMKFGGTSLQDAASIRRAVSIVADHRSSKPVVVVSAVGGVTRELLAAGEIATSGGPAGRERLAAIARRHASILDGLELDGAIRGRAVAEIGGYVEQLERYVDGIALLGEHTPRTQDAVLAHGERFSAALFRAAAEAGGIDAAPVDAGAVVITDDRFRRARPIRAEIARRAADRIAPLLKSGKVPVIEGFIGATIAGVPTTMGFEASDYSASLLGAALQAGEIQIWTDVAGMLTTGHPAVAEPLVVAELTFDEARELARFGAKVLHPESIAPARDADIPVRILHSSAPDGAGTWIKGRASHPLTGEPGSRVKSIAAHGAVVALRGQATDGSRARRTRRRLLRELDRADVTPLLIAGGVTDTIVCLDQREIGDVSKLLTESVAGAIEECAIVCPVGDGIGTDAGVVARVAGAVAGLDVRLLCLGASPTGLPVVLARDDVADAVGRLHAEFF